MVLPATITSFTANTFILNKGQPVTLSWVTANCIAPAINGVTVSPSGKQTYYPLVTTTYTLSAYSEGGGTTRSLTVIVQDASVPPLPPSPNYYTLYLTTIPGGCYVEISGVGGFTSNSAGSLVVSGIAEGPHTITVSKVNYQTYSDAYSFTVNRTITITLKAAPIICTPGSYKCIGVDLYVCNTAGTSWLLHTSNSPICKPSGGIPDFWTNPTGWVVAVITQTWESMLGFVTGQFNLFLINLRDWQNNFATQLTLFIQDPLTKLRGWLDGVYATVSTLMTTIYNSISSWWASTSQMVITWIIDTENRIVVWTQNTVNSAYNAALSTIYDVFDWSVNAVNGINSWIDTTFASIGAWWSSISLGVIVWILDTEKRIQDWIGTQWNNLGGWWSSFSQTIITWILDTEKRVQNWSLDQIGILQRGWDTTFGQIPELINTFIIDIQDWVTDFVPTVVDGMFEWASGLVDPLLKAFDWLGKLGEFFTGTAPEPPALTTAKQTNKEHMDEVKRLLGK